jgi:hypothetical protein
LSAKFVPTFADEKAPRGRRDGSLRPYFWLSIPEPLIFLLGSCSIVLMRLSGPVPDPLLLRITGNAGKQIFIALVLSYLSTGANLPIIIIIPRVI